MEMLEVGSQAKADEFNEGKLDANALADAVDWKKTWGFPFAMYRPVIETAREKKVPLVALNAPSELVRKVAKVGVDGLSAEEKAKLPELDLTNAEYRAFVKEQFGSHHEMPPERFEKF